MRPPWRALLALWLVLVSAPAALASPQQKSGLINYVSDFAGVLQSVDQHALESELAMIGKTAGYQMAVVIYPRLPDGVSASDTTELADSSLVGSSLEDRGLVLFVFRAEKLVRLEVGYGLEALVTDAEAQRIVDGAAARFARDDYAGGVRQAVASARAALDNLPGLRGESERRWMPDWIAMYIDAAKGLAFLAKHARQLPKQLRVFWRAQDDDGRLVIGGLAVVVGLYLFVTAVMPAIGMLLLVLLPASLARSAGMRWFGIDVGSASSHGRRAASAASSSRLWYLLGVLYYLRVPVLIVGLVALSLVTFVGHPGSFGGAGARALW